MITGKYQIGVVTVKDKRPRSDISRNDKTDEVNDKKFITWHFFSNKQNILIKIYYMSIARKRVSHHALLHSQSTKKYQFAPNVRVTTDNLGI